MQGNPTAYIEETSVFHFPVREKSNYLYVKIVDRLQSGDSL
jgi:hypothetical protein